MQIVYRLGKSEILEIFACTSRIYIGVGSAGQADLVVRETTMLTDWRKHLDLDTRPYEQWQQFKSFYNTEVSYSTFKEVWLRPTSTLGDLAKAITKSEISVTIPCFRFAGKASPVGGVMRYLIGQIRSEVPVNSRINARTPVSYLLNLPDLRALDRLIFLLPLELPQPRMIDHRRLCPRKLRFQVWGLYIMRVAASLLALWAFFAEVDGIAVIGISIAAAAELTLRLNKTIRKANRLTHYIFPKVRSLREYVRHCFAAAKAPRFVVLHH